MIFLSILLIVICGTLGNLGVYNVIKRELPQTAKFFYFTNFVPLLTMALSMLIVVWSLTFHMIQFLRSQNENY